MVGIMAEGNLLEVVKVIYWFTTSGNRWHTHLLHTWREMDFNPTCFDPDFWIRGRKGGCDCIWTHTNDVLVVSLDPT